MYVRMYVCTFSIGVVYNNKGLAGVVCVTQSFCTVQGVHWMNTAPRGMGMGTYVVIATLQVSILHHFVVILVTGNIWVSSAGEKGFKSVNECCSHGN